MNESRQALDQDRAQFAQSRNITDKEENDARAELMAENDRLKARYGVYILSGPVDSFNKAD